MKNTPSRPVGVDAIAEARKDKNFLPYLKTATVRVRLAAEVYRVRKEKNLNQQDLAMMAGTTQRVISNIESGDVNVGLELLVRIAEALGFSGWNLSTIFDKPFYMHVEPVTTTKTETAPSNEN